MFYYICGGNSSNITIKHFIFMVDLKLSIVDCLAIESLLSQLDSNLELGVHFKRLIFRYRKSLRHSGVLPVKGDLFPIDFDFLGYDIKD